MTGRVSELTSIKSSLSAYLDPRPNSVPVENEAVMVLYFEDEQPGGADEDAVDVGVPPVAVQGEVVIGGVLVTQSRREKMGSERLLTPDSAPVRRIGGTVRGRNEKGDHDGDDTRYKDEGDACGNSGE